jgi:hypothetical protein
MSNLVLGTSIGYNAEQLEPFAKSLRKYYDGHIAMVVKNVDENLQSFFDKYNIETFNIFEDYNHDQICNLRHKFYQEILENNFLDVSKIFICDTRDVVFQADPFEHEMTTELEFFLEMHHYKNCDCNTWWLKGGYPGAYGEAVFNQIGDNYIICAGTTMGIRTGIIKYVDEMVKELNRILIEKNCYVTDQPTHGYLIYNGVFPSYKLYHTGQGPISTMNRYDNMKFDDNGNLLNFDGSICPIVHQWDRTGDKKDIFYKKAME